MSRSAEDWKEVTNHAVDVRRSLRDAAHLMEEWPAFAPDIAEESRERLEKAIEQALKACNEVVGETFVDWAWE